MYDSLTHWSEKELARSSLGRLSVSSHLKKEKGCCPTQLFFFFRKVSQNFRPKNNYFVSVHGSVYQPVCVLGDGTRSGEKILWILMSSG